MVAKKVHFPNSMFDATIEKHLSTIVNALWYIDGNKDKLDSRCKSRDVCFPEQKLKLVTSQDRMSGKQSHVSNVVNPGVSMQIKQLSVRDARAFARLLEKYDYTCGSLITPDEDALQGVVFVRLQLNCGMPIAYTYYSATITRKDVCCHCSTEEIERDQELVKQYKVVLPVCGSCRAAERTSLGVTQ